MFISELNIKQVVKQKVCRTELNTIFFFFSTALEKEQAWEDLNTDDDNDDDDDYDEGEDIFMRCFNLLA
jgi:hypothetical protein